MKIGYIRSNLHDEFYQKQINLLKEIECGRIFEDVGNDMKALDHMKDYLREDDFVFVYQFDRFGLNVKNLMRFTADLMERNVAICSIKDNIDTSADQGELLFKIFKVLSLCEENAVSHEKISSSYCAEENSSKTELDMTRYKRAESTPTRTSASVTPQSTSDLNLKSYKNVESIPSSIKTNILKKEERAEKQQNVIKQVMPSGGRPRGLSNEAKQKAEAAAVMYQDGTMSMREIASNLSISTATLYSYLRHEKVI